MRFRTDPTPRSGRFRLTGLLAMLALAALLPVVFKDHGGGPGGIATLLSAQQPPPPPPPDPVPEPIGSIEDIIQHVSNGTHIDVGYNVLGPGPHTLNMTLQASGAATAIDSSEVVCNGTVIFTSNDNTTSAFEHHWTAEGAYAAEVHHSDFTAYTNDGAPGIATVGLSHLDATLESASGPGDDETEATDGVSMPVTYNAPDFPASFPLSDATGRTLTINIASTNGGTLLFDGTGPQLAVYQQGTTDWEQVTAGIPVTGTTSLQLRVQTSNQFTGPVLLTPRLQHATSALDAADAVNVVYAAPQADDAVFDVAAGNPAVVPNAVCTNEDSTVTFAITLRDKTNATLPAANVKTQNYSITAGTDATIKSVTAAGFTVTIAGNAQSATVTKTGGNTGPTFQVVVVVSYSATGTKTVQNAGTVTFDDGSAKTDTASIPLTVGTGRKSVLSVVYKDHWGAAPGVPLIDWGTGTLTVDMPCLGATALQKAKITLEFSKAAAANAEFDNAKDFKFTLATKTDSAAWTNAALDQAGTWDATAHKKTVVFEIDLPASVTQKTVLFDIYAEQPATWMLWVAPPTKKHGTVWKLSGTIKWKTDGAGKYTTSDASGLSASQGKDLAQATQAVPVRNIDHP